MTFLFKIISIHSVQHLQKKFIFKFQRFRNVSLNEILPAHIRDVVNTADSSLFYRLTSIAVEEKHIIIVTQIRWKYPFESDEISYANVSVKWNNEDRIITWIDDIAINDFLNQVLSNCTS